jgi:uncharacterized protein
LAADQGNIAALIYLANMYEQGNVIEKSHEKAAFYYQKQFEYLKLDADQGNPHSQATVGWYFENGIGIEKSLKAAIHYYQLSANQNSLRGLYHLASCFAKGLGVPESKLKAVYYYKKSADQGFILAQAELGRYLIDNKIDEEQGFHYLKLVVQQGSKCTKDLKALCQYYLGRCFEKGEGISKSEKNAIYYYQLAIKNGSEQALTRISVVQRKENLDPQKNSFNSEYEKIKNLTLEQVSEDHQTLNFFYALKQSKLKGEANLEHMLNSLLKLVDEADKGLAHAQYELGMLYLTGHKLLTQSDQNGFLYLEQAAKQNLPAAQFQIGICYEDGKGVTQSKQKAFKYMKLAADQGYVPAQFNLGRLYRFGDGTNVNLEMAMHYYRLAIDGNREYKYYYDGFIEERLHACQRDIHKNLKSSRIKSQKIVNSIQACLKPGMQKLDISLYKMIETMDELENPLKELNHLPLYYATSSNLSDLELRVIQKLLEINSYFVFIGTESVAEHFWDFCQKHKINTQSLFKCIKIRMSKGNLYAFSSNLYREN